MFGINLGHKHSTRFWELEFNAVLFNVKTFVFSIDTLIIY